MKTNKVLCPLMESEIEETVCFDIHMVAENMAPEQTAPKKAIEHEGYREVCLSCPNHRE